MHHSFHSTVIPSGLLSFLLDYCHSFQISVIPSRLVSFLPNIVIPSELLPFQIFVTLSSSGTLPYPKGEKNGPRRWPYMRVLLNLKEPVLTLTYSTPVRNWTQRILCMTKDVILLLLLLLSGVKVVGEEWHFLSYTRSFGCNFSRGWVR